MINNYKFFLKCIYNGSQPVSQCRTLIKDGVLGITGWDLKLTRLKRVKKITNYYYCNTITNTNINT